MTICEAVLSVWRQPLLSLLFLLITGQMVMAIAAFRDGRSLRTKLAGLLPFFLGAAVLWLCLTVISWDINRHGDVRTMPSWLAAFCGLPVTALALAEALLAVLLILSSLDTIRYRKEHPTPGSIKETMDLLPVGIAYARRDGTVLLRNLVMDRLSQELTGKPLTNLNVFLTAAGIAGDHAQASVKGRVWQVSVRETAAGDEPLLQLTASDITEQAGIIADLEAKNKKLRDIHLRLEIYNRQAERIIIAQELLTARMTVHNELGNVLLESRHYMNDPASIDEELLLQALKNANTYLLREYEKDDTAVDALAEAVGTAEAIGVKVSLTGVPPAEGNPRLILAAAIRECATNAVKHAGGDRLTADIRSTGAADVFTLRTNGRPPAVPVRETGGLLSLRMLAERQGGTMRIAADPAFTLTIRLPRKDEG